MGSEMCIRDRTITVDSVNDAPVAGADSFNVAEDGVLNDDVLSNDSDLDGDTLTVNTTPVVGPANGTVDLNADGTFTYTPNGNFFGTDSFTYEAADGNGGTARATVNITIDSVNDAPVAVDDNFNVNEDDVFSDELLSNCLLYTSPSPRDGLLSRMPSSA